MSILDDNRTIDGIFFEDEDGSCYTRDTGFTILPYMEPGPCGNITWLAVMKNGAIIARVPSWKVSIVYNV